MNTWITMTYCLQNNLDLFYHAVSCKFYYYHVLLSNILFVTCFDYLLTALILRKIRGDRNLSLWCKVIVYLSKKLMRS